MRIKTKFLNDKEKVNEKEISFDSEDVCLKDTFDVQDLQQVN